MTIIPPTHCPDCRRKRKSVNLVITGSSVALEAVSASTAIGGARHYIGVPVCPHCRTGELAPLRKADRPLVELFLKSTWNPNR
jgi:hypothetical protein